MSANYRSRPGEATRRSNRRDDMAAYDRLPPIVRRALAEHPTQFCAMSAADAVEAFGEALVYRALRDEARRTVATPMDLDA